MPAEPGRHGESEGDELRFPPPSDGAGGGRRAGGLRLPGTGCAPITLFGNPVLRRKAPPVEVFDASIRRLVDELFETMYAIDTGVGLAANQIGRPERVFVFDCRDGLAGHVVNPVVHPVRPDELQKGDEGCLSLPGESQDTVRLAHCRVTGFDARGNEIGYDGSGLRARCFQHETDHLEGLLYIDHQSPRTRRRMERRMRSSAWYGRDALDPASELYRDAQGFEE